MYADPSVTAGVRTGVAITISGGHLQYLDSDVATLADLNMLLPAGKWTCLLGRSGCGKTSLLRYLAGLLDEKVTWSGALTTTPACDLHGQVAYMAQQDLLMPWLTVLDNVMLSQRFGEHAVDAQRADIAKQKAFDLLARVGLVDKADYRPSQLSGGMRQRVALARTLMQDKPIVLMDEPFSALDAVTRYKLQNLACELLQDKTVVLITHDPQEAIRLADALYIMQGHPAAVRALTVPASATPRDYDADCAALQQAILTRLERDDE
ncbi:hydroxymethylpyrimidine ABC transporter ATPase component [Photobacterium aphoticum]|uniref:Hydroxymethylpyrimidine ABC transporter ATPase component n=1 Tax=Photobacterium aphoticum TaxID=754436 RepID=A0A090QPQ6_9GAMM|nr:hydroxymethylpyrimidine ABC transporter ATPase component [Photobacterium aphoticum]